MFCSEITEQRHEMSDCKSSSQGDVWLISSLKIIQRCQFLQISFLMLHEKTKQSNDNLSPHAEISIRDIQLNVYGECMGRCECQSIRRKSRRDVSKSGDDATQISWSASSQPFHKHSFSGCSDQENKKQPEKKGQSHLKIM